MKCNKASIYYLTWFSPGGYMLIWDRRHKFEVLCANLNEIWGSPSDPDHLWSVSQKKREKKRWELVVDTNRGFSNFKILQESALSVLPQSCECSSTVRSGNALNVTSPACYCTFTRTGLRVQSRQTVRLCACRLACDPTGLQVVLLSAFGFCASGEVDGGLVLFIAVDVLEVDHHVQGVGEDEQQDQWRDETHEDGRGEERGAVAGWRELVRVDIERLNLVGIKAVGVRWHHSAMQKYSPPLNVSTFCNVITWNWTQLELQSPLKILEQQDQFECFH